MIDGKLPVGRSMLWDELAQAIARAFGGDKLIFKAVDLIQATKGTLLPADIPSVSPITSKQVGMADMNIPLGEFIETNMLNDVGASHNAAQPNAIETHPLSL